MTSLAISPLTYCVTWQPKTIYPTTVRVGTIHFPDVIETIPTLPLYYKGARLVGEQSKMAKSVTYSINAEPSETEFYVLITPVAPTPVTIDENTIKYFKVPKHTHYVCYKLIMQSSYIQDESRRKKEGNMSYSWLADKVTLDNERIPLNTITIIYNPKLIDKIDGGDAVMLPKICFKGSAQEHADYAVSSLLASIDTNPFHAPENRDRVIQANLARKTIVTLTT